MPIASGQCPNCGATVEFRNGASMSLVCPYCRHVAVRSDRGLEKLGEAADVAATENSLAVGDRGSLVGRPFEVLGRLVLDHPAGGTWEEYYIALGDDAWGWLANEQGRWEASTPVEWDGAPGLKWSELTPGASVSLGPYGKFVVAEQNKSVFATAQGELPFAARTGTPRFFADLSGPDGGWATLDFGESEAGPPKIYVGRVIAPADLWIERGGATVKPVLGVTSLKCPNCGGALTLRAGGKAERVACPYCRAISDIATLTVIDKQAAARSALAIPLGSKGRLSQIDWTVIGYMERSGVIEGETFYWSEYLLYNADDGFRWLVYDEGSFWFGTPASAGDVDTATVSSGIVRYRGHRYNLRNSNDARVEYVVGEFYWKVTVGERVAATDFECGTSLLSREVADGEISWTFSTRMPSAASIFRTFGVNPPDESVGPRAFSSGSSSNDSGGYSYSSSSGGSGGAGGAVVFVVIAIVALIFFAAMSDDCDGGGGDGYGGGHSSHSYGGFGGK